MFGTRCVCGCRLSLMRESGCGFFAANSETMWKHAEKAALQEWVVSEICLAVGCAVYEGGFVCPGVADFFLETGTKINESEERTFGASC